MLVNNFIRTRRLELNLTLQNVADFVGVGKGTVQKWESGLIKDMRRSNIASLAKILNVSPALLLKDEITEIVPYKSNLVITEKETEHIKNYRQLSDDGKAEIDALIQVKLNIQNQKSKDTRSEVG